MSSGLAVVDLDVARPSLVVAPEATAAVRLRPRWRWSAPAAVVATTGAVVAWLVGATTVEADAMGPFGLVSVLPWTVLVAPVLVVLVLGFRLRSSAARGSWAIVVALAVMAAALPAFAETSARGPTAWLHAGFVDHLVRTGEVLEGHDARFSWPGWFGAAAGFEVVTGIDDPAVVIRWTPALLAVLWILPLRVLISSLVADRRRQVLAGALFVGGNWVGQDYYSPQGFAFLAYLSVVAAVVRHGTIGMIPAQLARLVPGRRREAVDPLPVGRPLLLAAVLAVVVVALAPSHQLTPFALAATMLGLAATGHRRSAGLGVLAGVAAVLWLSFGAVDYWLGHLDTLTGGVGEVGGSIEAGVGDRISGDRAHVVVLQVRLAVVGGLAALAMLGAIRSRFDDQARVAILLVLPPAALTGLQAYGGEAVLRAYLFALPGLVVLAARALPEPSSRRGLAVGTALAAALVAVVPLTRYGNDQFLQVSRADLTAVAFVERAAPPGAPVVAFSENLPWRARDIERHEWIQGGTDFPQTPQALLDQLGGCPSCWLVITGGQVHHGEALLGLRPGWADGVVDALLRSGGHDVVYRDGDAVVVAPA